VDALIALGRPTEALRYAQASRGLNAPTAAIACACEAILLSQGMKDEAYRRYAIEPIRAPRISRRSVLLRKNILTGQRQEAYVI